MRTALRGFVSSAGIRRGEPDLGFTLRSAAFRFRLPGPQAALRPHAVFPVWRRRAVLIRAAGTLETGSMPDFLPNQRSLTIAEIVALTRAEPGPGVTLDAVISDIAPLDSARASDISFLGNPKYLGALATTRAGACLVMPRFAQAAPAGLALLVTAAPYRAFVTVARALFPDALRPSSLFGTAGRASEAHIHPRARLEAGVTVDPLAVIGPDSEIGTGTDRK